MKITCAHCDSTNVQEQHGVDDVYVCNDCGEYFEGDEFELEIMREHLHRVSTKELLGQ